MLSGKPYSFTNLIFSDSLVAEIMPLPSGEVQCRFATRREAEAFATYCRRQASLSAASLGLHAEMFTRNGSSIKTKPFYILFSPELFTKVAALSINGNELFLQPVKSQTTTPTFAQMPLVNSSANRHNDLEEKYLDGKVVTPSAPKAQSNKASQENNADTITKVQSEIDHLHHQIAAAQDAKQLTEIILVSLQEEPVNESKIDHENRMQELDAASLRIAEHEEAIVELQAKLKERKDFLALQNSVTGKSKHPIQPTFATMNDDAALAQQLNEQLNSEKRASHADLDADAALALQLQQEWNNANNSRTASDHELHIDPQALIYDSQEIQEAYMQQPLTGNLNVTDDYFAVSSLKDKPKATSTVQKDFSEVKMPTSNAKSDEKKETHFFGSQRVSHDAKNAAKELDALLSAPVNPKPLASFTSQNEASKPASIFRKKAASDSDIPDPRDSNRAIFKSIGNDSL